MSFLHPSSTKHRPIRRLPGARLRPVALAAASALGLLGAPLQAAGPAPTTLPNGLNVVHGQAQVATVLKGAAGQTTAQMTVRNSAGAILNWNSFSIGAQAGVHFQQADAASKVLNRVTGSDPSAIFGSLTSNGQVWLLNPNGVLFGAGARVDVAGLVASTLRLDDNSFLDGLRSGRFSFGEAAAGASVRNEGAIRTAHGGHLVMLSERVENTGTLDAPGGALLLAGAKAATLVDSALPYLAAVVPAGEVLNLGRAAADGGVVDVYAAVVNQQGLVRADTVALDAQGRVVLKAADTLMLGAASRTSAVGTAEGSTGGRIDLLGTQVGLVGTAMVDASGVAGGGSIRLGGGLMGRDASVANARAVFVGPEALLLADATGAAGMGGSIILWSDEATRAYGRFSARGGSERGDGGFVETSGGWIDARPSGIDVTTRGGVAGTWLIDPNNLTISDTGPDTAITGGPSFTTTGDGARITTATIATALNAGNSVTLTTATGGTEAGDILMLGANLSVAPPSAVTLTLQASRDIIVQDSTLTSSAAPLNLDFQSAGLGTGVIDIYNSTIATAGGNVRLGGQNVLALPLPGGDTLPGTWRPAVSYLAGSGPASLSRTGGRTAINIEASTLEMGSGSLVAVGLNTVDNQDGVSVSSDTGATTLLRGAVLELVGVSVVPTPVDTDVGVFINGNGTDLVATERITIDGAGRNGVGLTTGARIALNGGVGAGASLAIRGWSSDDIGVALLAGNFDPGPATRGSRLTVNNGSLLVQGRTVATAAPGVEIFNVDGAPGPILDLATATGATLETVTGGSYASGVVRIDTVGFVPPAAGTLTLRAPGVLNVNALSVTGAAGPLVLEGSDILMVGSNLLVAPPAATSLTMNATRDILVRDSVITSTGSPLSLNLVSAGGGVGAIEIQRSSITTAGGDVTLGGATAAAMPLPDGTFTTALYAAAIGYDPATAPIPTALSAPRHGVVIDGSIIDAGTGDFSATGLSAASVSGTVIPYGVRMGPGAALVSVRAANIDASGFGRTGLGMGLGLIGADLEATAGMAFYGAGTTRGVTVTDARISLNAAAGSGARLSIDGFGGLGSDAGVAAQFGVLIQNGLSTGVVATDGFVVVNGAFEVTGRSLGAAPGPTTPSNGRGVQWLVDVGAAAPVTSDFRSATGVLIEGNSLNGVGAAIQFGTLQLPTAAAAASEFTSISGSLRLETLTLTGAGNLSLLASDGAADPGDIQLTSANFGFAPGTATTLLAQAARDIVVQNSSITSTGSPLNLDFQAAGNNAFGVVSIDNSTLTTAGGNVTLGGTFDRQLPLPGGGLTPENYRPARAYSTATGGASLAVGGGQDAVRLESSVISLGAGTFRAVGEGALDARDGVVLSSDSGSLMRLTAARVELIGHAPAPTAVFGDRIGVIVGGQNTEITATQAILIQAAGDEGGGVESGARVTLAGSGSGSVVIDGYGGVSGGAYLASWDLDTDTPGRGTRITVTGGTLSVTGRSAFGLVGVTLDNTLGAPGPLLDLAAAGSGRSFLAGAGAGSDVLVTGVDIVPSAAGTLAFSTPGLVSLSEVFVSGAGGTLEFGAGRTAIEASVLNSTAGPLTVDFLSLGATPSGLTLNNTIIETRGGTVSFGDLRTVSSPVLGATAAPGYWLETDSSDSTAALSIRDSVIDAGSGSIRGGGSVRAGGVNAAGLDLFRSVLTASGIELAGRSDYLQGMVLAEATLNATGALRLAGDSASNFPPAAYGLQVGPRSTLQLVDPSAATGSAFALRGRQLTDGIGLLIEGGAVGSGNETLLSIEGAAATLSGTGGSGSGLVLLGSAAGPGGAFINAAAAPSLRLEGLVTLDAATGGTGTGLQLLYARVIGPQLSTASPLDIVANGGGAVGAGLKIGFSSLSSGGVTTVAGNSIAIADSLVSGDGSINLYTADQGASAGSVVIDRAALLVGATADSRLYAGTRTGGPAIGVAGIASGNGIQINDVALSADVSGGTIELRGTGAATGGSGVVFARSPMTAPAITMVGRGGFDGDGVFSDDLSSAASTLQTANLSINGLAAHDPAATELTRAGVVLGRGVVLDLDLGGTALIEGDLIALGRSGTATGTGLLGFQAFGGPASFAVNATRSMQLREASLDFSSGAGTAVTLRGDTDGVDGGRVRLNLGTQIVSGGGPITLEGQGALASVPALGLPAATVVAEGSTGVFLSGADLFAGSGVITLTGRGIDSGSLSGLDPAASGILIGASTVVGNTVNARRVVLNGAMPSPGFGVTIGGVGFTASNSITADEIVITGEGLGTFASTGRRAPGVQLLQSASLTGNVSVVIDGLAGTGVDLQFATVVSLGSLDILGAGPVRSTSNSFVSAEGALSIQGVGNAVENGVELGAGTLTRGDSVLIRGINSAGARGVLLQADDGIGNITTYTGAATITAGSDPLGGAVAMFGRWILNPAGALNIESPGGLELAVGATSGLAPLFGGDAINLSIPDGGTVTYGPGGSIDAALFQAALPTAAVPLSLRVVGGGALEMAGSLSVAGRLRLDAEGGVAFIGSAAVVSTAPGDAIVIGGDSGASPSFVNLAGASALSTPAGRWVILTAGPATTTLGGLTPAFSAYGLGAAPWTVDGAGDLITPIPGNALGYSLGTAAVSGAALTVLQTRAYDATASLTLDPGSWAVSGLVAGDALSLSGPSAATMADKNVGVAKPVTADAAAVFSVVDAGGRPVFGYGAPALAATITPLALTVSGTAVSNKVYDGGVGVTIASLGGVTPLAGDGVGLDTATVTASFVDRNVGTAKPVLASGFALTGADAGNYTLVAPTGLTADITPLGLAVTGLTAANKVYDTTTLATLSGSATIAPLGGDVVTVAGTALASFADKNVGSAKPVSVSGYTLAGTDAGNYTLLAPAGLVADITPATLAISGLTAANRVYDATTAATISGTATLAPALGTDAVSLSGSASGSFADKNVGSAKPVVLGGLTLAGADAGNYLITTPGLVADITPADLAVTGLSAASRVYDASTTALLTGSATVAPLGTDGVTLAGTAAGSFADKNVGTAKPVSVGGLTLAGADAANYTLVLPTGLSADITARALAVTGVAAADKVYDGTTAATLTGTAAVAPLGADVLTLGGSAVASFADKNAGAAKPVSVSGYTLAGADAGNYALVQPAGLSATISAAPLALTGLTAVSREYDRSTVAPLAGTAAVAPLAGDVVTLTGTAAGAFATAAAATGKAVTVSGLALAGADAANYTLRLPTGLSADVTPLTLTLAGLAAAGRVYDAGTTATVSGTLAGVLAGDGVSLVLGGSFVDANAGIAKPVTVSAALAGADAANYTLAAPGLLSADITAATLRYVAVPAFGTSGQALPALTGDVSGFLGADTRASATTGTLAWTSPATAASPTGLYAINGSGLTALNYRFVQDAANATALTLRAAAVSDPVTTTTTVVTTSALFSVSVPLLMSSPTEGRTLDVTPAFASSVGAEAERRATIAAAPGREGAAGVTGAAAAPDTPAAAVAAGSATAASPAGPSGALGAPAATPATSAAGAPSGAAAAAAVLPSVAAVLSAASSEAAGGLSFGALDFSRLPRDEIQTLLAARARYKKQIFADGIYRLQQDPTLADVRACRNEAETDTGQCLITEDLKRQIQAAREEARRRAEAAAAAAAAVIATPGTAAPARPARVQRRVVQAALPVIERKLALLIGVNDYADKAVPQLTGAVLDSRAVRERLEQRMGYETTVLESPSRSEIVRAFNRLALEAQPGDSVIVYYAGHGVVVPVNGVDTGFWLPADTDSRKESTWLSNADIGRLVAAIGSRQLMLVSDSCYSGTLVGKERGSVSGDNPDEMLKRRAAVVMSSGGDEPVADEGKDGHSFFAWHFMRALEGLDRWQVGNSLHDRLRTAVSREFPQTPQYGGSRGLGHENNTDFLFERREIEKATQAP